MPTGTPTKKKKCAICGKLFLPAKPSTRICSEDHYIPCPICEKPMIWNSTSKPKPCSRECSKENTRRNNRIKYGCDHPMQNKEVQQHHKESMLNMYGVESPLQSPEIRSRAIKTNTERFGTDWALGSKEVKVKAEFTMQSRYGGKTTLQSEELLHKVESTNLDRYGVKNPMQNKDIQKKQQHTLLDRYGVENPMQVPEIANKSAEHRRPLIPQILEKSKQTWMKTLCVDNPSKSLEVQQRMTEHFLETLGVNRPINDPECRKKMNDTMQARYHADWYTQSEEYIKKYGYIRISNTNRKFAKLLQDRGVFSEFEFRVGSYIYDLYIPSTNTLIEINPAYTHNTIGNHWNPHGVSPDYHEKKTKSARDNGYNMINVWDSDDWNKIIDIISPPLVRIYARQCKLYKLYPEVGQKFIDAYDIYGNCRGQVLYIGLVYEGNLVQVMSLKKAPARYHHDIQIARLCTKARYQVVGGVSKLLHFAMYGFDLYDMIVYNDLSKFSGHTFEKIGMKLDHINTPQLLWFKEGKYISDNMKYLYHKTKEDMISESYLPVYNCGTSVYVI